MLISMVSSTRIKEPINLAPKLIRRMLFKNKLKLSLKSEPLISPHCRGKQTLLIKVHNRAIFDPAGKEIKRHFMLSRCHIKRAEDAIVYKTLFKQVLQAKTGFFLVFQQIPKDLDEIVPIAGIVVEGLVVLGLVLFSHFARKDKIRLVDKRGRSIDTVCR